MGTLEDSSEDVTQHTPFYITLLLIHSKTRPIWLYWNWRTEIVIRKSIIVIVSTSPWTICIWPRLGEACGVERLAEGRQGIIEDPIVLPCHSGPLCGISARNVGFEFKAAEQQIFIETRRGVDVVELIPLVDFVAFECQWITAGNC